MVLILAQQGTRYCWQLVFNLFENCQGSPSSSLSSRLSLISDKSSLTVAALPSPEVSASAAPLTVSPEALVGSDRRPSTTVIEASSGPTKLGGREEDTAASVAASEGPTPPSPVAPRLASERRAWVRWSSRRNRSRSFSLSWINDWKKGAYSKHYFHITSYSENTNNNQRYK